MKNNSYLSNQGDRRRKKPYVRNRFQHFCFIIPEYMNKKIVENGTEKQKEKAWKNLILTEQLRGRRQVTALMPAMFAKSDKLHRTIFDAHNAENLPGTLVLAEGGKLKGGKPVSEAYDYSGDTYKYYQQVHDRNSVD